MTSDPTGLRIVLYGPGRSGKTRVLHELAAALPGGEQPVELQAADGESAVFEFVAVHSPADGRPLHLLSVPGRLPFAADRRLLLRGADAVLFIADSRAWRLDANLLLLDELGGHLQDHGLSPGRFPLALLYTWRQDADALPLDVLQQRLNPAGWPALAAATPGDGSGVEALQRLLATVPPAR